MSLNYYINKSDNLWPISHTFVPVFLFIFLRTKAKISNELYHTFFIIACIAIFEIIELTAFEVFLCINFKIKLKT